VRDALARDSQRRGSEAPAGRPCHFWRTKADLDDEAMTLALGVIES
jgi:hypothetical protein